MKDIGARVGISAAAVSMALAGSTRISEATRTAVRDAAQELGYVSNSAGRALRSRRANVIALIVPNSSAHVFGHLYFTHLLTGMSSTANEHDAQVVISTSADTASGRTAYERVVRSGTADGAIVTSAAVDDEHVEALVESGLPVVLIGRYPAFENAVSVGIDDVAASADITGHLIQEHHRTRLLHVSGPLDHQAGIDRQDGFLQATANSGASLVDVVEGDFGETGGAALVRDLLERGAFGYDAVVFANDDMAVGGLRELRQAGLRVPDDVAVVGFDDFGLARVVTPGLTTVRVPAEAMARVATKQLFELIEGKAPAPGHTEHSYELVIRESCGCR